jgi:hypothetical protein
MLVYGNEAPGQVLYRNKGPPIYVHIMAIGLFVFVKLDIKFFSVIPSWYIQPFASVNSTIVSGEGDATIYFPFKISVS